MSTTVKVLVAVLVVGGVLGLSILASGVGTYNDLIAQERGLEAQYKNNQNIYDNYFKKVQEAVQVSDKYAGDLRSIFVSTLQGRYGDKGSKAVFQFIKEHNPNLDSSVYLKLQQIIESGRNDFQMSQTTLLDKKRVYETNLQQFPTNLVAQVLGFPRIDLKNLDIVTSETTEKAFQTKRSEPLKLGQ